MEFSFTRLTVWTFRPLKQPILFCSPYGIRTHILDLEDRCPFQLNEGAIFRKSAIAIWLQVPHVLHTAPRLRACICHCDFLCTQGETRTLISFRTPVSKTGVSTIPPPRHYHFAFFYIRVRYDTFSFCTPHRIRTDTCTGFKSVASANWATGAYKTKNPNFFRCSGLYLIWSYLLHYEINPNFAQPEPTVLIHNVLFTTIVRFKLIFRFIVFIISYILKSLSPFSVFLISFTNIRRFL